MVAPATQKWQLDGSDKASSCDLGHLLTKAVEKAQNSDEEMSEVLILLTMEILSLDLSLLTVLSCHKHLCTLQFLGCVAPNVSYHIPRVNGMIQEVAV